MIKTSALISEDKSMGFQYVVSFYWAISTVCSVGYGDIHAQATREVTLFILFFIPT